MPRAKKKIHYIYKTTCNITNRYYIGMHSTNNIDDGYMGSGKRLRRSIRKHGKDNHTKEILGYYDTRELLIEAEIKAITEDMVTDKDCMNLMGGGKGGFVSDKHQKLLSKVGIEAFKVRLKTDSKLRDEYREYGRIAMKKLHESGKVTYGTFKNKNHSEESKKLIGEANKGKGVGSNNSQYGKCWITNGIESKKIFRGDDIPEGWSLGRKMK